MAVPSPRSSTPEHSSSKRFSGSRVLVAIAIGAVVGVALAYFLKVLIDNTPADLDLRRLRLFYLMVITACALAGFAIESTRQLQEQATDPVYRHPKGHRGGRKPRG
ncbi:MAG: hypothetical protein VKI93_06340 [Synechococcus sp.]|nr:hypothetical protein [Synechococcus sp.]